MTSSTYFTFKLHISSFAYIFHHFHSFFVHLFGQLINYYYLNCMIFSSIDLLLVFLKVYILSRLPSLVITFKCTHSDLKKLTYRLRPRPKLNIFIQVHAYLVKFFKSLT